MLNNMNVLIFPLLKSSKNYLDYGLVIQKSIENQLSDDSGPEINQTKSELFLSFTTKFNKNFDVNKTCMHAY